MFRKRLALLLVITLAASFTIAGKKKKSGGGWPTVNTSTIGVNETASTAMALRGIVEPEGATCCVAIALNQAKGIVTARERKSGRTFKFNVPANVANELEFGDNLRADFRAKTVQIEGIAGQFTFGAGDQPCCSVVAIHGADGTVTVKEPAVGRTFQLKVSAELLQKVRIGQKAEANFKASTATLPGLAGTYQITNLSQPGLPQL